MHHIWMHFPLSISSKRPKSMVESVSCECKCFIYLWTHVFAGPVSRVGLGVDVQDMVEVVALRRRLHSAVQNGRRTDVLGVEPAAGYSHI